MVCTGNSPLLGWVNHPSFPGAPSGVGGGNPGDAGAGASGASDQRAARERYRNALFDREAGACGIS